MLFHEVPISGVWVLELERHEDERGHFARTFCAREMEDHGLATGVVQCSISFNPHRGTLRGLHWQAEPHGEVKLVRCTRGEVWDVVVDVRPASPTYRRHFAVSLSADGGRELYVPAGLAHGFLTTAPDTEIHYQMSAYHRPESARGARWDDPAFAIQWPERPRLISARDAAYPDFGA